MQGTLSLPRSEKHLLPFLSGTNHLQDIEIQRRCETRFLEGSNIIKINDLQVKYSDRFELTRSSNTTPIVVLHFEAETKHALVRFSEQRRAASLEPADTRSFRQQAPSLHRATSCLSHASAGAMKVLFRSHAAYARRAHWLRQHILEALHDTRLRRNC